MPGHRRARSRSATRGVSGTGNNGDTMGFDTLYGDGTGGAGSDLAVFPAADYTPANRSHFDSRDYWFAGALQKMQTGWLGRWLDTYGSQVNPLQAISLDSLAVEADPLRRGARCARSRTSAARASRARTSRRATPTPRSPSSRPSRPARATTASPARARSTA